jgi:hypothetical protein
MKKCRRELEEPIILVIVMYANKSVGILQFSFSPPKPTGFVLA